MAFGATTYSSAGIAWQNFLNTLREAGFPDTYLATLGSPVDVVAAVLTSLIDDGAPSTPTLTASTSLSVGATPTPITQVRVYSQTITPASVAANVAAEQTFTVTGLATTDKVVMNPAATGNATAVCSCRVTAANTIGITYENTTAGALTPGAGTYNFIAFRS